MWSKNSGESSKNKARNMSYYDYDATFMGWQNKTSEKNLYCVSVVELNMWNTNPGEH